MLRVEQPLFLQQLCYHNHPPVCLGILAVGKVDELIAVFSGYADVIERQFFALCDILVKLFATLHRTK